MKKSAILLLFSLFFPSWLAAHCQIPCGIYGDEYRFDIMMEHVETVRKSTNEILAISDDTDKNYNQLVRWVNNKELHARKIQDICYDYFLAQRIQASMDHYVEHLKAAHAVIVHAMKTKQQADPDAVDALESAIQDFRKVYFHGHDHPHKH